MIKQVPPESYAAADDDGEGTTYGYDPCGRLSMVKDQSGNILRTYEYDGHGNLVREVDGEGGEKLSYYNSLGLKVREEIQVGKEGGALYRVVTYAYDNQGNKVEEAYGCQETVSGGRPETWHKIYFSYDPNNRLSSIRDDYGAQMRFDYDCFGKLMAEERVIEDGICQKVQYKYDRNGRRISRKEEIQGNDPVRLAVTTYGYDGNGNLVSVKTPKGFAFHMEYDGDDRLSAEHIADKKNGIDCSIVYSYNEIGKVLDIEVQGRGDKGGRTSYRYDLKDRMTHQINASGAVVRYIYNRNGQITARIGSYGYDEGTDSGIGMSYSYDSRGNCTSITNAFGEKVEEAHYDLCNHLDMSRDALGSVTTYEHRLDGQVSAISRDYGGHKRTLQQYEYNARGQIVGIIDGNQEKVSYDTDGWGKITRIGFSDGVEEAYQYIPAGQVSTAVDGNGNEVQYRYNSMGKVRERIDQLGEKETFLYDAEGNLSLHIDRDGRRVSRGYNVFGDPVYERAVDADGGNACTSTWHYDSIGRVIRAVCNGHSYEYRYDSYGNLERKCSNGGLLVSYTYDKAGQITEIKDRNGTCTLYGYDALGRKERIHNDQGLDIRYSYDSQNRLQGIRYGNGVETRYTYDGDGNIGSLETRTTDCVLLSFRYQYDGNGNRTAREGIRYGPEADGATSTLYRYDIRGQLLEERDGNDAVSYAYDAAGNRIRKANAHGETRYIFNRKNQMVRMEGPEGLTRYSYDREGGVTEEEGPGGVRRYAYNSLHQQVWACTEDGDVQENRYDAEGLRYEMSENGKRHRFIYHGRELLSEQTEGGGWTSYHLGGLGIDAACRDNKLLYYHKDEQNSTAYLTDRGGKAVNSYQYDAFGNDKEVTEKLSNRIRYAGQQYDCTAKQYYLRARYYSPSVGRFMQEDAYWGDGLNLYAYCRNNPVMYYDPSGYGLQEYLDVIAAWEKVIIENWENGRYSTYKERLHRTPAGQYKKTGQIKGSWEGDRGESLYIAFDYSDAAVRANQVIYQYGQKGITYSNCEPNFRPVSEAVVSIENMMNDRYGATGNFWQADVALAEYLNEHPNCELYEKIGINGTVTWKDIENYREANDLTWHEENDGKHMDLVSEYVNATYGHLGGVAEQKRKERGIEYNVEEDC